MMLRPSDSSRRITEFYRRYLLTTFHMNDPAYDEQLRAALSEDKAIADGPYLSVTDPYEKGCTLETLAQEGVIPQSMVPLHLLPSDCPLFAHQEQAVRRAVMGRNLIVTTGTSSGKTECFMIPLIAELLAEQERGTLGKGVRALLLYPMNALVNDQVRRLRTMLKGTGITFGKFTGETEETYDAALPLYQDEVRGERKEGVPDDAPEPENELISREQIRETPPHILITNYAMLEYLLLRPGDNALFTETNARTWRTIVLDEAHTYNGSKGIEVASLLRRLKAALSDSESARHLQFILTSATLGDNDQEIVAFGQNLCGESFAPEDIIRASITAAVPEHDMQQVPMELYRTIADLLAETPGDAEIAEAIRCAGLPVRSGQTKEMLYDLVLHDTFYPKFRNALCQTILTADQLAAKLAASPLHPLHSMTIKNCLKRNTTCSCAASRVFTSHSENRKSSLSTRRRPTSRILRIRKISVARSTVFPSAQTATPCLSPVSRKDSSSCRSRIMTMERSGASF